MKQWAIFLVTNILNLGLSAQAPQLVKVTPPSPNVMAMQKYGDIPVSAYTGIPNISIPIYTVKFRDITVPISLSYHASGIKVGEEASQVGLGWALNAGGSISRNVIGEDDLIGSVYFESDVTDFTYNQGMTDMVQYGCTLHRFNRNIANNPTLYDNDLESYINGSPAKDFQPDQYYYNFLDQSGKFVLKRNRQASLQKEEKIDINCLDGEGNAWQIKSVDGYTYDFTQFETYRDNENTTGGTPTTHKSAWYLTKITSPAGNSVTFNYTVLPDRYVKPVGSYSESRDDFDPPVVAPDNVFFGTSLGNSKGSAPGKEYSLVVLNSIDFSNGVVKFIYSDNRLDLPGDQRLDEVSIYQKDAQGVVSADPLKIVELSYEYFDYGNLDEDYTVASGDPSKRLKLKQVLEKGYYGGTETVGSPYVFNYYESDVHDQLPAKTSFARDHWGYYNGKTENLSLIPISIPVTSTDMVEHALGIEGTQRDPNPDFVKAFSLASIQHPTGGTTEFQYEANDFDEKNSQKNDNSYFKNAHQVVSTLTQLVYDHVVGQHFTPSNLLDLTNEYVYVSGMQDVNSTNVHLNAVFRFSNTSPCVFNQIGMIYFDIQDEAGNTLAHKDIANFTACQNGATNNCSTCGGPVTSYNTDLLLPPGKYYVQMYVDPNSSWPLEDVHFNFSWYEQQATDPAPGDNSNTFLYAGGLRIKRIIDHDGISPAHDKVKRFVYHFQEDRNHDGIMEEYSYGKRMARPGYAYFDCSFEKVETPVDATVRETWESKAFHLMRTSDSNIPLNGSAAGSIVGYDQVTVLEGENGENGKTVYEYINEPDIVNGYNNEAGLPMRPPYASNIAELQNGSLFKETTYKNVNGQFQPIKKVTNTYNSTTDNDNTIYGLEVKKIPGFYTIQGQGATSWSLPPCDANILLGYRTLTSQWNNLASTTQRIYDDADTTRYMETLTNYFYDNSSHFLPTRVVTKNSKGETITTTTKYPLDYPSAANADALSQGVQSLKDNHIINAPLEKIVQKTDFDGTHTRTVGAVVTQYNLTNHLPTLAYNAEMAAPVESFTQLSLSSTGASMDGHYQPLIYFDAYDSYGNLLQQHKVNDVRSSYVWGYNYSLPVAESLNAEAGDIRYTSFESESTGGWNGIYSSNIISSPGITGDRYYEQNAFAIIATDLQASQEYVVTYWTIGNAYTLSGTEVGWPKAIKSITLNQKTWTLYEHHVNNVTSVALTGSGALDELRLYPIKAQMTTYTHAPLIGITSIADANGEVTYYEYDGLGRLKNIKDYQGSIVKNFQYNYRNGCGSNCFIYPMQSFNGHPTPGYPVGVFSVDNKLIGNANSQTEFVSLWNSNSANHAIGNLAAGSDALHFNLTLNPNQQTPSIVNGCRYYQFDFDYTEIDAIRNGNGAYVDFGDGNSMKLGVGSKDVNVQLPTNTTMNFFPPTDPNNAHDVPYFIHTYPDNTVKTITIYHNDGNENPSFDNLHNPATSMGHISNFRGNYPQFMTAIGSSCLQMATASSVDGVNNWNSINSVLSFGTNLGDNATPTRNLTYAQDFMANNKGLTSISTTRGTYFPGYSDATFKISRLKSDWNMFFTKLKSITINDDQWDREDLSALTQLSSFILNAGTLEHGIGGTVVPIPSAVVDNILNQIASGAGRFVSNGLIRIDSGNPRTSASDAAVAQLKARGWAVSVQNISQ